MTSLRALACAAGLVLSVPVALADIASSTVTVTFQSDQTIVSPAKPTINLAASPSVVLELRPGNATFDVTPVLAVDVLRREAERQRDQVSALAYPGLHESLNTLANAPNPENLKRTRETFESEKARAKPEQKEQLDRAKKSLEDAGTGVTQSSNRFLLNFHRGWWWEYKNGNHADRWERAKKCSPDGKQCHYIDFISPLPDAGWDIYLVNRTYSFDFPVVITCKGPNCQGSNSRLLVIHVDTASWAIAASAGLMFPFLRDERYAVNEKNELVRLSDGDIPYSAATYLHYCPVNGVPVLTSFCPTLAVGSKVPSDGVLVGLGLSGHIKPLESVNAAYLNLGVVYGPHKTLNNTYLAKPTPIAVQPGLDPKDVLDTHYAFKFFIGLSIGITGGIEKFRGVFPGTKGESTQVQPAPPGPTAAAAGTATTTATPTSTPTPTPAPATPKSAR